MTRFILSIVYFLVVTPIGLLQRLFGRSQMELDFRSGASSYWRTRKKDFAAASYRNQFYRLRPLGEELQIRRRDHSLRFAARFFAWLPGMFPPEDLQRSRRAIEDVAFGFGNVRDTFRVR